MSAIAGILCFDGASVEPGLIERLTHAMRTRGPDAQTHWTQGAIALGHCMLRATPESLVEQQPLLSIDGQLAIVWDGRLDNRDELYADLKARGARFRNESDAELALVAYEYYGEKTPEKFLGDFAFAVWNQRTQSLFLARDHVGARPFYYTQTDRFFAFASEEEVLTLLPGASSAINEERLAYNFAAAFESFDWQRSWLRDIFILLPARTLQVSPRRTKVIYTYWKPPPAREPSIQRFEDAMEVFNETFLDAVRARARTRGSIGLMMSGGLDSSSILAALLKLQERSNATAVHTFSALRHDPQCVESNCIRTLSALESVTPHHVLLPEVSGEMTIDELRALSQDRPHPVDNEILLPSAMCNIAAKTGTRALLTGVSGDITTFAPFYYLHEYLQRYGFAQMLDEARQMRRNSPFFRGMKTSMILLQNAYVRLAPIHLKRLVRRWRSAQSGTSVSNSILAEPFAERLRLEQRIANLQDDGARLAATKTSAIVHQRMFSLDRMRAPEGYERVAGKHGVELRDPWNDRRVISAMLSFPAEFMVKNGWTKFLVRRWAEPTIGAVAWRNDKSHVGSGFAPALQLKARNFETLSPQLRTVLNRERVASILDGSRDERIDQLSLLLSTDQWLDRLDARK